MSILDDPVQAVMALPVFVLPLFVFVSAMVEYVFPPYWGDMFVLLGFFLAGQGVVSPLVIFASALAGSMLGAGIAYHLGRRYGLAAVRRTIFPRRRARDRQGIRKLLLRFGERVLIANRFIPVVRGLMLYGAGTLRLRIGPTIVYTALSNLIWLTLMMGIGLLTAGTWDQILATFERYSRLLGIAAAVGVALWLALVVGRHLWRRRKETRPGAHRAPVVEEDTTDFSPPARDPE